MQQSGEEDLVEMLWPIRTQNFFPDDAIRLEMRHSRGLCLWKGKMLSKKLLISLVCASIFCRCEEELLVGLRSACHSVYSLGGEYSGLQKGESLWCAAVSTALTWFTMFASPHGHQDLYPPNHLAGPSHFL